jgi:glutamate formiminotransferase
MLPVLEAVPNFSEGRDPGFLEEVVRVAARSGADVLDASSDPDHHRSVVTFIGDPRTVEAAALAVARVALEWIDLGRHQGTHPRIGALDVLPFVPLVGCSMDDAIASARRVGERLQDLGVPVYYYGEASTPRGRRLSDLRRGGVEALGPQWPMDRRPDLAAGRSGPHPTAGATCVGARHLLLAWNLWVDGVSTGQLRSLATDIREASGGFPGLRALAMELPSRGALQLSMNLEDVERRDPMEIVLTVEERLAELGGRITRTEVIGMVPETLVLKAAGLRLRLSEAFRDRLLPVQVARHLSRRGGEDLSTLVSWVATLGSDVPHEIRSAVARLDGTLHPSLVPGMSE